MESQSPLFSILVGLGMVIAIFWVARVIIMFEEASRKLTREGNILSRNTEKLKNILDRKDAEENKGDDRD